MHTERAVLGSSPLARGREPLNLCQLLQKRVIPARAGEGANKRLFFGLLSVDGRGFSSVLATADWTCSSLVLLRPILYICLIFSVFPLRDRQFFRIGTRWGKDWSLLSQGMTASLQNALTCCVGVIPARAGEGTTFSRPCSSG